MTNLEINIVSIVTVLLGYSLAVLVLYGGRAVRRFLTIAFRGALEPVSQVNPVVPGYGFAIMCGVGCLALGSVIFLVSGMVLYLALPHPSSAIVLTVFSILMASAGITAMGNCCLLWPWLHGSFGWRATLYLAAYGFALWAFSFFNLRISVAVI